MLLWHICIIIKKVNKIVHIIIININFSFYYSHGACIYSWLLLPRRKGSFVSGDICELIGYFSFLQLKNCCTVAICLGIWSLHEPAACPPSSWSTPPTGRLFGAFCWHGLFLWTFSKTVFMGSFNWNCMCLSRSHRSAEAGPSPKAYGQLDSLFSQLDEWKDAECRIKVTIVRNSYNHVKKKISTCIHTTLTAPSNWFSPFDTYAVAEDSCQIATGDWVMMSQLITCT